MSINILLKVTSFPLFTQCSTMDQAVALAVRSRRFESSFNLVNLSVTLLRLNVYYLLIHSSKHF